MKKLRRILPLVLVFTMLLSISAFADWKSLKNTGAIHHMDTQKDMFVPGTALTTLNYAETQLGYKGVKVGAYKRSYWVYEWGPGKKANPNRGKNGNWGNWCSEFAWWSLYKAGVLSANANVDDCDSMRKAIVNAGGKIVFQKKNKKDKVSASTLKPGDIVLLDTTGNGKANHTAIVEDPVTKSGKIFVIEGNANENKKGETFVQTGKYPLSEAIYVCRPRYKVAKNIVKSGRLVSSYVYAF